MKNEETRPFGITLLAVGNLLAAVYLVFSPQVQASPTGSYVLPYALVQVPLCVVSGISLWRCLEWGRLLMIGRSLMLIGSHLFSLSSSPYITDSMAQMAAIQIIVSLFVIAYLALPSVRKSFYNGFTTKCHICGSTSFSWSVVQVPQEHSEKKDWADNADWQEKMATSMDDEVQTRRCNNCSNIQFFKTDKVITEPNKERREHEPNGADPDSDTEEDAAFVPPEEMGLRPNRNIL